nr:MAG TPA: hypothetical protein [Bacteriophage sp.]DAZ41779.1 MAG TPA: hypothetical protein [Caudoviricetes sp.]
MKVSNEQYQYEVESVHISQICVGDTILHTDGQVRTVCHNDITIDSFMGRSLFGDTYNLGTIPIKRIRFVLNDK